MTSGASVRARAGKLILEAAMVVFAVLIALALEEWRQEQRLIEFAERAEAAVVAELEANLQELDDTRESLVSTHAMLAGVIESGDISTMSSDMELVLPELSQAAWEVAQGSEAAPYFEYEWVIRMARAYEVLDIYSSASDNVIGAMSAVIGREPTIDHIADIFGWLSIINGLHLQAAERLRAALDESAEP